VCASCLCLSVHASPPLTLSLVSSHLLVSSLPFSPGAITANGFSVIDSLNQSNPARARDSASGSCLVSAPFQVPLRSFFLLPRKLIPREKINHACEGIRKNQQRGLPYGLSVAAIASYAVNGARRNLMYVCISRPWGIGSPASQHPILAIAMGIPISELARF
jgi:hypothetical protein